MELCLALDIGGTKLAAALVSRDGDILAGSRQHAATPAGSDAEHLFAVVVSLLQMVIAAAPAGADLAVCGVGAGGPMDLGGEQVSPLNIGAWRRFPLRGRLEQHLGLPTLVDNDAKALALGEGWRGAARGQRSYLAMVVSTGVGGGLVLDGRLLQGARGNAGHIGHVVVEPEGRACVCGGRGCLEAEVSGPAVQAATGRSPADAPAAVVERCGRLVGRAVASVANLLDLQMAVVAGSVALGFGAPFFAAANRELHRRACLEFSRDAHIRAAGLGPDGPLVGAGAVGWSHIGLLNLSRDRP